MRAEHNVKINSLSVVDDEPSVELEWAIGVINLIEVAAKLVAVYGKEVNETSM